MTVVADTDKTKLDYFLRDLKCKLPEFQFFRLGEKSNDKPRPIKMIFQSENTVTAILSNSKILKDYTDLIVYVKPDKTKADVQEYQRLGKRKEELIKANPTTNGGELRVKLQKGILSLDGIKIDSYQSPQSIF